MRTLLVLTCLHDLHLTRNLFQRIARLNGWQYFSHLHLHLDNDVSTQDAAALLAPVVPLDRDNIIITRTERNNAWRLRRAETMLGIYQMACRIDQDIVRLDPDVYIASPDFFRALAGSYDGIAGKLMPLYLPASVAGRQLNFVQGGASFWGPNGRRFIQTVRPSEIEEFRSNFREFIDIGSPRRQDEYTYFFTNTEDVVLTGVLAIVAGVERTNIPLIQVSPYDVIRNYRGDHWGYQDLIDAYSRSGALAYHFEGAHDGRRAMMSEMLERLYQADHIE